MANSPVVSSLPAYVEQRRLPLISKAVLGAKTARLFTIQSGIKGAAKLNLINSDIVLQSGAACGWNEAGTSTPSQRELNTALLKINMAYCDKKLIRTWAEYGVRIAAGQKELPFEEEFLPVWSDAEEITNLRRLKIVVKKRYDSTPWMWKNSSCPISQPRQ